MDKLPDPRWQPALAHSRYLSNLLGILLTAGLFIPFAIVRTMKYRLSCITVHASYDLDDIVNPARFGDSSSDL